MIEDEVIEENINAVTIVSLKTLNEVLDEYYAAEKAPTHLFNGN